MLRFLGRIRQQLLSQNKFSRYLLYAIGEIVLVVIGILLALQVNDWNEQRKNRSRINTAVDFLLAELKEDSLIIDDQLNYHLPRSIRSDSVYQHIIRSSTTIDTILYIMQNEFDGTWTDHFDYKKTAYQNMMSSGVLELLPDSIKRPIVDLYKNLEENYKTVEKYSVQYRERMDEYSKTYTFGFMNDNLNLKELIWSDIDPKHLWPRSIWMAFTKSLLFDRYVDILKLEQEENQKLIRFLEEYKK